VIHRDLKPENILINQQGRAFLGDVGVAKVLDPQTTRNKLKTMTSVAGTEFWMAPEALKLFLSSSPPSKKYNLTKMDVFSLGLISLFCLDTEGFLKIQKIANRDRHTLESFLNNVKTKVPIQFFYPLRCMLSFTQASRPSLTELHQDVLTFDFLATSTVSLYIKYCF
jgi:serine/threonine protein kinase